MRGLRGNIYSLGGRDGLISGSMNTLSVDEAGSADVTNLRSVMVICRHLLIHLFFAILLFLFILFIKALLKLFFPLSLKRFLVTFGLLLGALFESSSISVPSCLPTYYPSTIYLPTCCRTSGGFELR
jgi:hypothetical protein